MKIPSNIMNIHELVDMINEMQYIDCKKDDYYDTTYESIIFYLNWCKNWFLIQQIDNIDYKKIKEILHNDKN